MSTNTITPTVRTVSDVSTRRSARRKVTLKERPAYDALHRMMLDKRIMAWCVLDTDAWIIVENRDGSWPVPYDWPVLTLAEVHTFLAERGHDQFAPAAPTAAKRSHVGARGAGARAAATKRRNAAMEDLLRRAMEHLPADLAAEADVLLGCDVTVAA